MVTITVSGDVFTLTKQQVEFDAPNKLASCTLKASPEYFATLMKVLSGRPEVLDRCPLPESFHLYALAKRFELPRLTAFFDWKLADGTDSGFEKIHELFSSVIELLLNGKKDELPTMKELAALKPMMGMSIYGCPAWKEYFTGRYDPLPADLVALKERHCESIERLTRLLTKIAFTKSSSAPPSPCSVRAKLEEHLPKMVYTDHVQGRFYKQLELHLEKDTFNALEKAKTDTEIREATRQLVMHFVPVECLVESVIQRTMHRKAHHQFWTAYDAFTPALRERLDEIKASPNEKLAEYLVIDLNRLQDEIFTHIDDFLQPPQIRNVWTWLTAFKDDAKLRTQLREILGAKTRDDIHYHVGLLVRHISPPPAPPPIRQNSKYDAAEEKAQNSSSSCSIM